MNNISEEIINEHLDMMIRLALKQAEAEGLLNDNQDPDEPVPENVVNETFDLFLTRLKEQERRKCKEKRSLRRKRILKAGIRALVCLILILALAMPVAIASIDSFRSYVVGLLIQEKDDHLEIQVDKTRRSDVPADWSGSYYPEYIPEGYHLSSVESFDPMVIYINDSSEVLYFSEYDANTQINIDSEDAIISFISVNESTAVAATENGEIRMVWNEQGHLFELIGILSINEAQKIASSVTMIFK